jgi:hypothetical protein
MLPYVHRRSLHKKCQEINNTRPAPFGFVPYKYKIIDGIVKRFNISNEAAVLFLGEPRACYALVLNLSKEKRSSKWQKWPKIVILNLDFESSPYDRGYYKCITGSKPSRRPSDEGGALMFNV